MDAMLTSRDAAASLGVSDKTLRHWVKTGVVRPVPGSGGQGRASLFRHTEVEAIRSKTRAVELLARVLYAWKKEKLAPTYLGHLWVQRHESIWSSASDNLLLRAYMRLPACHDKGVWKWARAIGHCLSDREIDVITVCLVESYHNTGWVRADSDHKWFAYIRNVWLPIREMRDTATGERRRMYQGHIDRLNELEEHGDFRDLKPDDESLLDTLKVIPSIHQNLRTAISAMRTMQTGRRKRRSIPSSAAIGRVLGVSRMHSRRLLRCALRKMDRAGLLRDFAVLFDE